MNRKHPEGRAQDRDLRFSAAMATIARTQPIGTASLRAKQWATLKEWSVLSTAEMAPFEVNPQVLQDKLLSSKPDEWRKAKSVLVGRNWPIILEALSAWRRDNPAIIL